MLSPVAPVFRRACLVSFQGGIQISTSPQAFQGRVKEPEKGYSSKFLQRPFRTGFIQIYAATLLGVSTGAQNVIVKVLLPQPQTTFFLIHVGCLLFETLSEIEEVTGGRESQRKKMQMIRHHTKGVYNKLMLGGFSSQVVGNPYSFLACAED